MKLRSNKKGTLIVVWSSATKVYFIFHHLRQKGYDARRNALHWDISFPETRWPF